MSDGLFHFRCPICQALMVTRAANSEHQVECPECNTLLAVPFCLRERRRIKSSSRTRPRLNFDRRRPTRKRRWT